MRPRRTPERMMVDAIEVGVVGLSLLLPPVLVLARAGPTSRSRVGARVMVGAGRRKIVIEPPITADSARQVPLPSRFCVKIEVRLGRLGTEHSPQLAIASDFGAQCV